MVAACGILCCGFSSSWSGVELRVMCPVCRMLQAKENTKQTLNKALAIFEDWCERNNMKINTSKPVCGNKMPTRCNWGFYCRSYCLLNMFRAPLCPSSGVQEYYTVVAACGTHNPQLHTRSTT